ncbi:hypothetical protein B0H13DRAFT_1629187, partial [Mycena leptocephala]
HKCPHRRTGIVYNVTPFAVGVLAYKVVGNHVNLRVEHVRHSKWALAPAMIMEKDNERVRIVLIHRNIRINLRWADEWWDEIGRLMRAALSHRELDVT